MPSTALLQQPLPLALAVFTGALLSTQFATNGALVGQWRSLTLTAATSYLVGALFLFLLLRAQRLTSDWPAARRAPRWAWLGGVVGSAYVVGSVLLTRTLGAALVIAAQIVTAILLDHFGVLGLQRRRLNQVRLLTVLLAQSALGLRLWEAR